MSGLFSHNSFFLNGFFCYFNSNSVSHLFFLFVLVVASHEKASAQ